MIQSMLRSVRPSRMVNISSELFSETWSWLSFIVGYIRKGLGSHIKVRRSAFIELSSHRQDAPQSVQRESKSDQYKIKIKECKSHVKHTELNKN
eukprot:6464499-Amphidinium_carterae.1